MLGTNTMLEKGLWCDACSSDLVHTFCPNCNEYRTNTFLVLYPKFPCDGDHKLSGYMYTETIVYLMFTTTIIRALDIWYATSERFGSGGLHGVFTSYNLLWTTPWCYLDRSDDPPWLRKVAFLASWLWRLRSYIEYDGDDVVALLQTAHVVLKSQLFAVWGDIDRVIRWWLSHQLWKWWCPMMIYALWWSIVI
jgi:hypothetical protein